MNDTIPTDSMLDCGSGPDRRTSERTCGRAQSIEAGQEVQVEIFCSHDGDVRSHRADCRDVRGE